MSVLAELASSINLTCSASGSPTPSYRWFKDNLTEPLSGETKPYLYISEVQPNDRGSYTCEAQNSGGSVKTEPARVNIPGISDSNPFQQTRSYLY